MDFWKRMDITHRYQRIMNPVTEAKLNSLIPLLKLKDFSSVLDIGCGKGELLIKLAENYRIKGVGVDKSPYCIKDCNKNKAERVPDADLVFHLMDGAEYRAESKFDMACCVGSSWVFGGHEKTLKALSTITKLGGIIIVGEPHWLKEPDSEYLEAEGVTRDSFLSHHGNVRAGEQLGLRCIYTLDSDREGWDYYECLHWWAVEDYLVSNSGDPDASEIHLANEKSKETYLRWGRDTLGWSIYIFKNSY